MMGTPSAGTTADAWRSLVHRIGTGKNVGGSLYAHVSAVPRELDEEVGRAAAIAECPDGAFNVVRFGLSRREISLLSYPAFFVDAFPILSLSWTVDLEAATCERRGYPIDANPPVLHRKELLLRPDDPLRPLFAAVTSEAERRGLFDDPAIIGHRLQWEEELRARGLRVAGHTIVERHASVADEPTIIARHKTALVRRSLSTPMQALWRHGFLDGQRTLFDYGCGRGDDVAALRSRSIEVGGWDPYFRPDVQRVDADVVNLGFVLNVIEEPAERRHALQSAFALAREVLAVAALIGGRTVLESQRLFRDGIFTRAGTFQKYFTHPELGTYVAEVLEREPVSIGPGLYFVFRTDEAEQAFFEHRQRSGALTTVTEPPPRAPARPIAPRKRVRNERLPRIKTLSKWEQHTEVLAEFWRACILLGRIPVDGVEFPRLPELKAVTSVGRALAHLASIHGVDALENARTRRRNDLLVVFALSLFERRRSFGALTPRLQRDVREFWGSYDTAAEHARTLLFSVSNTVALEAAARDAAAANLGYYLAGDAFLFDSALANELPEILRVYVGCAGRLHGDVAQADLVKVHVASRKLSVMTYDDFDGAAIPMLVERVKIDLGRQTVHYFEYGGEFESQPLYLKSRHMDARRPMYEAQRAFDRQLVALDGFDWTGFGPPLGDVLPRLSGLDTPEGLHLPKGAKPAR